MRFILSILFILIILSTTALAQSQSPTDYVKSVQDDARVQAAFDHIEKDKDYILREWIAITEINAPSKQEQERAKPGLVGSWYLDATLEQALSRSGHHEYSLLSRRPKDRSGRQ